MNNAPLQRLELQYSQTQLYTKSTRQRRAGGRRTTRPWYHVNMTMSLIDKNFASGLRPAISSFVKL